MIPSLKKHNIVRFEIESKEKNKEHKLMTNLALLWIIGDGTSR